MLVMMPQVHCVEGSRVKNIKKQFEVLSNESTAESDGNGACALTSPSECKVPEKPTFKKAQSFPLMHDISSPNGRRSVNLKENVVKNEKCNIKRTPAFRCDRIVKGKNVTGQTREKHISVEDKVKIFEDSHAKVCDSTQGKLATISEHSSVKGSGQDSHLLKEGSTISKPARLKSSPNSEQFEHKLNKSPDSRYQPVSTKLNLTKVPVRVSPQVYNTAPRGKMVSESSKPRNGFSPPKRDTFSSNNLCNNKDSISDILRSPLPRGPPPRKPPRTFAHVGPQSTAFDLIPKTPTSIKLKENPERFSTANTVTPLLIRSKTESQIQLRSKLETALSKHTPGSGNAHRSSVIESKQQNWTHPGPVKPPSKPDLTPSSLLVGCLSLGCVNSNNYEEVGAHRKVNTRPGDRRESLDIRLSSADVVEAKNNLVSLGRSQNQDHIYAVPFGDAKSPVKTGSKPHNLLQIASESSINRSEDALKEAAILQNPETNGLHYMCTPILSQGKPTNTDGGFSHSTAVQQLNSIGIGKVQKSSLSHLSLKGLVKFPENLSQVGNHQIQPVFNQSVDTMQQTVSAESPLDDSRESSLVHSFGKDGFNRGSKTSLCSPSTETEEENCEDEHDPMMEEILEKRKGYVRRVCGIFQQMQMENSNFTHGLAAPSALSKSAQNSRLSVMSNPNNAVLSTPQHSSSQLPTTPFPHLFECVLLVGLTLSSNQDQGKCYEPYIKSKFPADVLVPPWIEHLCFPDAADWPLTNSACSSKGSIGEDSKKKDGRAEDDVLGAACRGRTYSLVITGPNGNRRFGYCRRVLPEGGSLCLPLNYCLISPYRANGFYFKVLAELESRHGQPEAERTVFLEELYSCPLPGPGQIPCPSLSSSAAPSPFLTSLRRPYDTRLEERDVMELFCCLEVGVFLDVFASLLLERKVLLTSKSLSKLSSCIEALQSVLYPFSWQHTFIPVLPAPMLDICHAPTPYIIGVLKGCNGQVPSIILDEGIMVDLDTSHYLQRVGDEGSILPSRIKRALLASLRLVSGITPPPQANVNKNNSGPDGASPVRNVLVSEAFLRMFLMVIGHYPNHIAKQQDGQRVFQRESFIKAMPFSGVQMFLEWFTETAMFSAFIYSRLEGRTESADGIFEQRAHKFCEELEKDALLFLKNYKAITKKHKTFGDRLKDWTSFS